MKPMPTQIRELYIEILNHFLLLNRALAEKGISHAMKVTNQIATLLRDLNDELLDGGHVTEYLAGKRLQ